MRLRESSLLPKEQRSRVLESYNIISIPEILLIDPEGNILAKGLRVSGFMKQ